MKQSILMEKGDSKENKKLIYFVPAIFIVLSIAYYFVTINTPEPQTIFLSISTFIFSIFSGFMISRQGKRYDTLRDNMTKFDGIMTATYRNFGHFGKEMQDKVKNIISEYYEKIISNNSWDYNFTHKTNTITSLHKILGEFAKKKKFDDLNKAIIGRTIVGLQDLQVLRKSMVSLHNERMPRFQFILAYFLAAILLVTVSLLPSHLEVFASILKSAFSSSIIFVLILLHRFDNLNFFEGRIGKASSKDVLEIMSGKK